MKTMTEFPVFVLNRGIKAREELLASGKTPEECQAALGESFKLEGDKLKYFITSMDIAKEHPERLKRVLVVALAENESQPPQAKKIEEQVYLPEYFSMPGAPKAEEPKPDGKRGGGKGRDRGGRGPGKGGAGGGKFGGRGPGKAGQTGSYSADGRAPAAGAGPAEGDKKTEPKQ